MELKDIISSGILELYSSGLTSEEDNRQVHEWIRQYPAIADEINAIQDALEAYALAHAIQPDESVKQKILHRIAGITAEKIPVTRETVNYQDNQAAARRIPAHYKWMVAASLILLTGSLTFSIAYYNKFRAVSANLETVRNELDRQKEIAAEMSKDMDVVTDKNSLPVVLNGTAHAPNALAKIFWMKNTGEVYVDPSNLPQPASGKQYQLWAIVNGKPVDAGMITIPKGTYKIQKMKSFGKAEAFAITLEKEGGSDTPNMQEMYVMATI